MRDWRLSASWRLHTETTFWNLNKSTRNQIIFTSFRLIGTKRTFVWFQINRKMINTIWFRVDLLIRFRKSFSVCGRRKSTAGNWTLDLKWWGWNHPRYQLGYRPDKLCIYYESIYYDILQINVCKYKYKPLKLYRQNISNFPPSIQHWFMALSYQCPTNRRIVRCAAGLLHK